MRANRRILPFMSRRTTFTPNSETHPLAALVQSSRLARNLTLAKVASKVSLQPQSLSDIEHGRRNASEDALRRLAKALGIDPKEILEASRQQRIVELKQTVIQMEKAS